MSRERVLRHYRAVAFFAEHAGYSYMPGVETPEEAKLRCAEELAQAEEFAREHGLEVEWQDDWSVDDVKEFPNAYDCDPDMCEIAILIHEDGSDTGKILGCIDDATPEYRRVIAAELADEARRDAIHEAKRAGAIIGAALAGRAVSR